MNRFGVLVALTPALAIADVPGYEPNRDTGCKGYCWSDIGADYQPTARQLAVQAMLHYYKRLGDAAWSSWLSIMEERKLAEPARVDYGINRDYGKGCGHSTPNRIWQDDWTYQAGVFSSITNAAVLIDSVAIIYDGGTPRIEAGEDGVFDTKLAFGDDVFCLTSPDLACKTDIDRWRLIGVDNNGTVRWEMVDDGLTKPTEARYHHSCVYFW